MPCSMQYYQAWCVLLYVQFFICIYPVQQFQFFLLLFCVRSVMLNYLLITALVVHWTVLSTPGYELLIFKKKKKIVS